ADAALLMQVLALPDERDSMSLPAQSIDWNDFDHGVECLQGLRIGLLLDAGCGLLLDPDIRAAVERAAALLGAAGARVESMPPFMTQPMLDGIDHFWRMRSHVELEALDSEARARVLPYIQRWADSVAGMDGQALFRAFSQLHATRLATVAACSQFDYVISPTSPVGAPAAESPSPTNDPLRALEHIGFTVPFNMSEQPAASINCGYDETGMPIGLQIAGRRFDDLGVLRVARAFELIRDAQRPWPKAPG
ncbi:MAG: amidase family protein, partial [Burkholderiales bacterium]